MNIDLVKALVAHPKWKAPAGLVYARDAHGRVFVHGIDDPRFPRSPVLHHIAGPRLRDGHTRPWPLPDIEHAATKGLLLAMLREAWGDEAREDLHAWYDVGREGVDPFWYAAGGPECPTEGEALASALLSVWRTR